MNKKRGGSKIEWTDTTWNPVHGCAMVSPGCAHCYAVPMTARLEAMGQAGYAGLTKPSVIKRIPMFTGEFREVPETLDRPLRWKTPRVVFVNSMSDLFGEGVSFEFIAAVFGVMAATPRHTYQVLTKRPERMLEFFAWIRDQGNELVDAVGELPGEGTSAEGSACIMLYNNTRKPKEWLPAAAYNKAPWPLPNVHLGDSVESADYLGRVDVLRRVPAAVRFLSLEPLLSDLGELDLTGIHWVIVGGESGRGAARPCDVAWIRYVVRQCAAAGVPCFVKQLGAMPVENLDITGNFRTSPEGKRQFEMKVDRIRLRHHKGGDPAEWPADLRVREMPRRPT